MSNVSWEVVKEFYKSKFGMKDWVVEMIANLDILSLCVSGASNDSIVKFLDIELNEVIQVLYDTFEFSGWRIDLPINPYRIWGMYDGVKSSVEHFVEFHKALEMEFAKYPLLEETAQLDALFYMCETYNDIEERINDEWI
jgi:hypothetical protein